MGGGAQQPQTGVVPHAQSAFDRHGGGVGPPPLQQTAGEVAGGLHDRGGVQAADRLVGGWQLEHGLPVPLGLLHLTAQLRLAGQPVAGHRGVGGTAQIQQPVPDPRGLAVRALLFQGERQVVGGARGVAGVSGGQGAARGFPGGGQVPALVLHHGQPEQRPGLHRGPGLAATACW